MSMVEDDFDMEDITLPPQVERTLQNSRQKPIKDEEDQAQTVQKGETKEEKALREEAKRTKVPGSQTIYARTWGCSHNSSDTEFMLGQLVEHGYAVTSNWEEADAYLLNSCTVKNPSEGKLYNQITKAQETGKPVIVSGCVPQGDKRNKKWMGLSVIGTEEIQQVNYVFDEAFKGNTVHVFNTGKKKQKDGSRSRDLPSLALPKVRHNPYIEIVPINVGCLNNCTYCKTKHARGDLQSWSIDDIEARMEKAIEEGVKEIRMTSEDTGAYGKDIDTNIAELLKRVVNVIPDGVMLRLGMTNPPYMMEYLDAICEVLNHPRVYSFLHIPIQAASDKVLYDMKREYTKADFEKIVDTLRARVPHMLISTDIICGFPTEDEDDFEETMELIRKYKFEAVNISQFYPRQGTPAARMKRLNTQIVKNRSRRITKLFNSYQCYDYLVGTEQRVYLTEMAKDGKHFAGHTKNYVQCLIEPSDVAVMGGDVYARITEAHKFYIVGEVIRAGSKATHPKAFSTRKEKNTPMSSSSKKKNPQSMTWLVISFICLLLAFLFKLWNNQ